MGCWVVLVGGFEVCLVFLLEEVFEVLDGGLFDGVDVVCNKVVVNAVV